MTLLLAAEETALLAAEETTLLLAEEAVEGEAEAEADDDTVEVAEEGRAELEVLAGLGEPESIMPVAGGTPVVARPPSTWQMAKTIGAS